ncbi:hypothetical protein [Clostridium ihumii]|uniref:hypothetical protein n=1 Tax=Clostridium ihumii TaxID=1470356 RepID=UPI003D3429AC
MPNYKDFDLDIQNNKASVNSIKTTTLPPTFSYDYDQYSECVCKPKTRNSCVTYCNGSCNQHTDCTL